MPKSRIAAPWLYRLSKIKRRGRPYKGMSKGQVTDQVDFLNRILRDMVIKIDELESNKQALIVDWEVRLVLIVDWEVRQVG